jgi:hypothetical protein
MSAWQTDTSKVHRVWSGDPVMGLRTACGLNLYGDSAQAERLKFPLARKVDSMTNPPHEWCHKCYPWKRFP